MSGIIVAPRWRPPLKWLVLGLAAASVGGCAARAHEEVGDDSSDLVPVPCVKVPLLKVPLTNRPVSNNMLEHLMPEPDQMPNPTRW